MSAARRGCLPRRVAGDGRLTIFLDDDGRGPLGSCRVGETKTCRDGRLDGAHATARHPAAAPRRRASDPNRAPRETAVAATSVASVALLLAPCRLTCRYCSRTAERGFGPVRSECSERGRNRLGGPAAASWACCGLPVRAARTEAIAESRRAGSGPLPPVAPRRDCSIEAKGSFDPRGERRRCRLCRGLNRTTGGRGDVAGRIRYRSIGTANHAAKRRGQKIEHDECCERPSRQAIPSWPSTLSACRPVDPPHSRLRALQGPRRASTRSPLQ